MSTDRQLLFGLLALQNEFISKQQLVEAFGVWMARQTGALEDILAQQSAINEDDRRLLSSLVNRHIAARGGDASISLQSLSNVGSIRTELEQLADADATLSIAKLRPLDQNTILPSMNRSTVSEQRFEIRRPLDRGGLGVVSIALDKELNREVALKEIRNDCADDEAYRSKFLLEAEVTGGLEHPGIVPVYALGKRPDGRPYYAMRLIKGDNFLVHIKRFHEIVVDGKERFDGAALRRLLRRFLDVCQAMEYAHVRGVLHRDLKPSNIMLGKYGETLVIDWGLAKPRGTHLRASSQQGVQSSFEKMLVPSGSNDGMTAQGSMVGTIAYAPPEQLSGDLDLVDERSDIYSLGAILYELLTCQPPGKGRNRESVIKMVISGTIQSPRMIQPQIPKALEAICRRAIATEPIKRFGSAAELGLEVERWLDDLPVKSYAEPLLLRARRWIRRHQSLVATIGVVVLMSTLGLGLYSSIVRQNNIRLGELNYQLDGQNALLVQAKTVAQEYKAEAINRYSIAKGAIDATVLGTSDSLNRLPGTQRLQMRLLQQAADDYKKLSENRSDDPELELERVRSLVRLADIYHLQNNLKAAHDKYDESLKAIDRFANQSTTSDASSYDLLALKVERGKIHARIGLAFDMENRFDESSREFDLAEGILRPLLSEFPDSKLCRKSLATTLVNKASLIERKDGPQAAVSLFNESLELFDLSEGDARAENVRVISQCKQGLGRVLRQLGRYEESRQAFIAARNIIVETQTVAITDPEILQDLASIHISKANLERTLGFLDVAMLDLEAATTIYKSLRAEYPDDLLLKEVWAINESDIGAVFIDIGNPIAAKERAIPAAHAFDDLVNSFPQIASYREGLATALSIVAVALAELEPESESIESAFKKSIELAEELALHAIQSEGFHSGFDRLLATIKIQHARSLQMRNQFPQARELFTQATDIAEKHLELDEGTDESSQLLAHAYWRLGLLDHDDHKANEAEASLRKAIELWKKISSVVPSPENRYQYARCLLLAPDSNLVDLTIGLEIMKEVNQGTTSNLKYSNLLADAFISNRDAKESRRLLDEIKNIRGEWNSDDYCVLAKIQSVAGMHDDAHESVKLANEWAAEHRPYSDDVNRFIKLTQQVLGPK
ncbi:MAG: serine/threonine-protein kinase [Pirellulaceae bacterium]|nr:serine/threonine-protein kinase [Pirellulaceae bacterium]